KKAMIAALLAGAMLTAGIALAAWIASGNGSAYSQAGTAQDLGTVDVSASTTADLFPDNNGSLLIEIHNPNPYPVKVTNITANGTVTADSTHDTAGCTSLLTDVSLNTAVTDPLATEIDVPASTVDNGDGLGNTQTTIANGATMGSTSDNACQAATFTIPVLL